MLSHFLVKNWGWEVFCFVSFFFKMASYSNLMAPLSSSEDTVLRFSPALSTAFVSSGSSSHLLFCVFVFHVIDVLQKSGDPWVSTHI